MAIILHQLELPVGPVNIEDEQPQGPDVLYNAANARQIGELAAPVLGSHPRQIADHSWSISTPQGG